MAFRYQTLPLSEVGKNVASAMAGGIDFDSFSLKDHILSTYGSIECLKKKAKHGQNWKAQADLAMIYQDGLPELNIQKDLDSAIGWYESSIQNGNYCPSDVLNLGTLHDVKGTVVHQRRAHELYLQAARLGFSQAELNLAESYRCGVEGVVNEDMEEAFKWYRRAAGEELSNEDEDSSSPIAGMKGSLKKLNIDSKLQALKKLHEYYMAGECPEGKPQPIKALFYLKKAAELGDPEAQKDLGLAYLTGESGHPKDLDQAKRWLGKAAKKGEQEAKEILKKFEDQGVVEITQPETSQTDVNTAENSFQQYFDIMKMQMKHEELHPYAILNPTIFQESTFTQFPDSPTAQHYLKAFQLVRKGLDKLQSSSFTDPEGVKLIAQGVLYENSITQSFPEIRTSNYFLPLLYTLICRQLKLDSNFFEGLLLMIEFFPQTQKISLESCKLDLRKTMSLNNLIHLIKKAEPDKPPKEDPYNFEEDYSSWLHVLYYYLASLYTITECFRDGAEAFQEALHCCPSYYEAKIGLAYCLMNIKVKALTPDEELLESFEPPKNQRVPKGDYLSWTEDQLRQKAKQMFMEYLQEAPECDKKYPHCHYHLAVLYMVENDLHEVRKWKEKGEDSEEKRLPFLEPVNVGSKKGLAFLDMLPIPKDVKKCCNNNCPQKRSEKVTLKPCPCHKASYCGSECQAEDWKKHKKICSHKTKKKGGKS